MFSLRNSRDGSVKKDSHDSNLDANCDTSRPMSLKKVERSGTKGVGGGIGRADGKCELDRSLRGIEWIAVRVCAGAVDRGASRQTDLEAAMTEAVGFDLFSGS
jgi:hypothetical protein